MNRSTLMRLAASFSLLGTLSIVIAMPIAAELRGIGGPGPIAFGDGEVLMRLASAGARAVWVDRLALIAPALGLLGGFGWYLLLAKQGALAWSGTMLWYVGMFFIVTQDALQLALVTTLPSAYAAADPTLQRSIAAMGDSLAYLIHVLTSVGSISGVGFAMLCVAMLRTPRFPRWIAFVGLVSSTISVLSAAAGALAPAFPLARLGGALGVLILVLVCMPAVSVVMWRRAAEPLAEGS